MSGTARDVVRYIKHVERVCDGELPRYRAVRGAWTFDACTGMYVPGFEWPLEDSDYAHARILDAMSVMTQIGWGLAYLRKCYRPEVWRSPGRAGC